MFLTETQFISKLLEKIRRRNQCQEMPRLRLFMIFKNSSFLIIKISDLQSFKDSKIQRFKDSKIFKDSRTQRFLGFREDNITFDSFTWLSAHSWPYRFILGGSRLMAHGRLEPCGKKERRARIREGDRGAPSYHKARAGHEPWAESRTECQEWSDKPMNEPKVIWINRDMR